MGRYKVWDKKEGIYTPGVDRNGKGHWSAEEYIESHAPWAALPGVKVIIGGGTINGTVFMEFQQTVEQYKRMGAQISDGMSDDEILAAIEIFEDTPPDEPEPTPEERIAAALELQCLLALPDMDERS